MTKDPYGLNQAMSKALDEALNKVGKEFKKELADRIKKAQSKNGRYEKDIKAANRRIVSNARTAMLAQYISERKDGGLAQYRNRGVGKDKRFSNGKMKRAIGSTAMLSVSGDGQTINFLNYKALYRDVPQWYRLNFGTDEKFKKLDTGEVRLNIEGNRPYLGKGMNFNNWKAGADNYMPTGFFLRENHSTSKQAWSSLRSRKAPSKARKQGFYLGRRISSRTPPTKVSGIRSYNYLEFGAKRINEEFAREVNKMVRSWGRDLFR